jgi:hypothetical protein
MRKGDCKVTPISAAERRSSPQSLAGIRRDFDRLLRARLGTVEFRDTGLHGWIAGKLGQRRFVGVVELVAKEKGVAVAFFDQITTAVWQPNLGTLRLRS